MALSRYWTAAATHHHEEQRAAHHVERQGFRYYLPEMVVSRRGRERRELLFPGYIFIKISRGWRSLLSTRGIKKMFLCGESPTRMADTDIEDMMSREDEDGLIRLEPPVVCGSRVSVQYGPMEGLLGIVKSMAPRDRCVVLLSRLDAVVKVELDRASLRVVE